MALGFIKKIFSFGKDEPVAPPAPAADAALGLPDAVPASPAGDQLIENDDAIQHRVAEIARLLAERKAAEAAEAVAALNAELAHAAPVTVEDGLPEAVETLIVPDELDEEPDLATEALEQAESVAEFREAIDETDANPAVHAVESIPRALPAGFASAADRAPEPAPAEPEKRRNWIERLRSGLARTSAQLSSQITSLFTKRKLDEETLQDLEDVLIQADLGVETAMRIADTLSSERYGKDVTGEDVSRIMAGEITKVLTPVAKPLELDLNHKPHVILVVGVNGTGKTTTIGKLAAKLSRSGLKVMLAAGDTFRAAAIEQLHIWATRTGADIVSTKLGADAAGLAFEAYEKARASGHDVLIIDTAGRLQNKTELMAELEKIVRVLGKLDPDAPHTVLQTLDATTGQNALNQVEIFRNIAGVSGLVMTKLDGTARGGILVAISAKHRLPVYFIGVGEGVDDLEPFNAQDFAEAIAGISPNK
jgi:fused signal recognition particle receptor